MTISITYQIIRGTEYGKIQGKSVVKDGKRSREGTIYLGKVIDKKNLIFANRTDGIFRFDPETGEKLPAPETYTSDVRPDQRIHKAVALDYGGSYFIKSLIEKIGYNEVIDSIDYKNKDTLYSMISYYTLEDSANCYAERWYRGNFAKVLYPNANLISQRISDFLPRIGDAANRHKFFDAHIKWVLKHISDSHSVILDSTGVPNAAHIYWTAISNHNGKINNELRIAVPVQQNSGFPLLFHVIRGNVVDVSTALRDFSELSCYNLDADLSLFDAGYCSKLNFDEMIAAGIAFVTRLPTKFKLYKTLIQDNIDSLKTNDNLVSYNGRTLYIKRVECKIGEKENNAYAYIGCDMNRYSDEIHKELKKMAKCKCANTDFTSLLENAGLFVLISTRKIEAKNILPLYYTRQSVEQFFDVEKGSAKLTPIRVHSAEAMYGHLLLSMISATLFVYIQWSKKTVYDSCQDLFSRLKNHHCELYKTAIVVDTPDAEANEIYNAFNLNPPISYVLNSGGKWNAKHGILRKKDMQENEEQKKDSEGSA